MYVAFVREAGGIGDCIQVGAACRQRKTEFPNDRIAVFCPEEFRHVYEHLDGIDEIHSLGSLNSIRKYRRARGSGIPSYIRAHFTNEPDLIVDLWCPAGIYETTTSGALRKNRQMLFCESAKCKGWDEGPLWKSTPEEEAFADEWFEQHKENHPKLDFIGLALRATCPARTYPDTYASTLALSLCRKHPVVYFDNLDKPYFKVTPAKNFYTVLGTSLGNVAAILRRCHAAVCVDSALMHLCQAVQTLGVIILGPTDPIVCATCSNLPVETKRNSVCELACNYSRLKNWKSTDLGRDCRKSGCLRMMDVRPGRVMEVFECLGI